MLIATLGDGVELRLLELLSTRYPTITAAHIEMINLSAILALPKGTDHYISDNAKFMAQIRTALHTAAKRPDRVVLLGLDSAAPTSL